MNEYDNIIQSYTEAGPAQATTAIGADPERATRALQLSRATGVPPLAVHEDLDRFEEDHKANLTANIVRGNSQISSYIRGNALADHVSNDDYGNLDESSRAFTDALNSHPIWGKGIPKQYIAEPLMEGLKGAIYGAAEGFTQEPFKVPENYSALSKGAYDFLGIPLRGLNAVAGGFMGGAGGLARQATIALGGDENQAARAEREARGIVESEMGRGGSGLQHADHAIGQVVRQNEALAVAKPWLDAGVDVPRGVHPLIDEIKVKTNDAWVDKIQTALDQAQNSLTKERDPELFKNFAQQHFEDAQMGISGDRVAALYGDKLPEPGDGLLGWVPGIAEKLEAARTFGEDVHVPLADWVTYMDPGLARELKDDIRAWPGGITKNEAALKDVAAPAIGANKEMTPVKEAVPEIEPRTLDERLDAYREEYRNMPEDATFDERGFRQSGLRDALDVVSSLGVDKVQGRKALDLAIKHDRLDVAEALVERAERSAQTSKTIPGVSETSPKYNEIKKNLERIKKEAEDYAAELREKLNEAKLKNDTLIDGALPQVRTSAALEPMFAIGDRPVKLEKMESKFRGAEEYNFVDHTGKVIGDITLVPDPMKKQLYVAMVGTSDLKPNTMGPSLMRDIKRQLKELYPEYETITGMRVSGARDAAGVTDKSQMKPVVKLALSDAFEMSKEYTDLRNILDTAPTKFGDVTADIKPTELYSKHEQAIGQAVQEEINRITGKTAEPVLASDIRYEGIDGIRGVYHKAPGEVAKILVSLGDFDATGIARHEAIHHLYREGFFKPEEWNALIEASKAEGWRERYDIDARYEHLNELGLHEEAIAEAFRDWAKTREQQPITPITTIFQKLWDLMQRIKDRVAKILGREPTFNELFEQAYSGELAKRELIERSQAKIKSDLGVDMPGTMFSVSEEPTKKGFVAYHGSPHEFEKFDSSKIGSGEGAQAYGYGLYFAEDKNVAQHYQSKLAPKVSTNVDGGAFGTIPVLKPDPNKPQGLYQVHIKSDPAKFLDWDKLTTDQSKAVLSALEKTDWWSYTKERLEDKDYNTSGKDIWHDLLEDYSPEEASRILQDAGIEGIQYLDGGSRRAGDGTRNFVVFDDKNVEITHKNGEPVNKPPAFAKGESPQEQQLKAEAAGLDAKSYKKIQDLIQKRYQEDIQAAVTRAEKEQRTIQSKEWKEAAKEVRKESEADVRARPDVQADLLIGSGELGGKKLERNRYELRTEDLSPEQKANLPRHYYAKDGVPVDVMANLFGYSDGNHLIEALADYNKEKGKLSSQEMLRKTIDEETNRRMEAKFGKLQDNIMLDAMDQALSETNLQILSEEWQGAAMAAGVKVVDKNVAKAEVMRMFDNMKMSDINVERLLGIMGKVGRDTERALIGGKNAEALVLMQRKYQTALLAAEARKVQKEQASAEKTFKTLSKREVSSMEPEYTDYAHQIMMQIGKPVRRSIQDLQEALARHDGQGNLKDFVERKQQDFRAIDAWDQLYDASWRKDYSELTTSEFRAIHDTIKTLVHNGREERKIYKAGEAADWADLKTKFVDSIQTAAHNKLAKVGKGKKSLLPDQFFTGVVQMETFLNRLDGYNPRNNWFQYVFRGLADGTAQFDKWKKDYAKKISALPSPDNLGRTIDNPLFKNQKNDLPLTFTRRDLIGVMLNTGNDTNLVKMAHGYKIKSDDVMAWVHQHATKKDWEFVQGIWDIFKEIKRDTDTMYRSLSGVAPENIPIRPIDTPHGQFAGGYYPLIRHPEFGDVATKRFKDVLAQENWVNTLPAAGHTKLRTGAIYPLATNLDYMVGHMNQMLFDNAMRPAIIQASKVFHDTSIRNAIYKYFGQAWEGELHDYIVGVANSQNYMAKNMQGFAWLSESLRQNMIGNVVGLNPSTPMKHGPTALMLSIKEVGPMEFAKAVRMMHSVNETTGAKWVKFVDENSLEIQRRDRNWQETLFGGVASHDPTNAVEYYRQKMIQFASKPVAWSDMASARPTWLAAYMKAMEENPNHGEAVALGDRAVRRAHGSTAITSRTAVQRNWNPWFVSIYNFWSDILNRQIETVWKAGDMYKLTDGNPVQKGLATAPTILGGAFAYVIWPMIVENIVSPHPHKDDESWASKAGKSLMFTLSGGWPILRDIGSAMAMGRDPQMGFTGTALSTGYNVIHDFMKNEPFNKEHAGRLIQDWASVVGAITGGPGVQLGRVLRFGLDTYTGKENPKNAWQWMVGLRYGTTNKHSQSFDEYMKGH